MTDVISVSPTIHTFTGYQMGFVITVTIFVTYFITAIAIRAMSYM